MGCFSLQLPARTGEGELECPASRAEPHRGPEPNHGAVEQTTPPARRTSRVRADGATACQGAHVSGTTQSAHILVVEDDRDLRETFVEALEDEGYNVGEASDGLRALE